MELQRYNLFFRKYPAYRQVVFAGQYRILPLELKLKRRFRQREAAFEFLCLLRGEAEATVGDAVFRMEPGDSVLLTHDAPAKLRNGDGAYFFLFRFELTENRKFPQDISRVLRQLHYRLSGMAEYAERFLALGRRCSVYPDKLLRCLVMELVFELLDRVAPGSSACPDESVSMHHLRGENPDRVIEAALSFIYDNFRRKLLPREVSDHLGVTLNLLNRIIKKRRGCTVLPLIWQSKLFWSAHRLHSSDEPVKKIAAELGVDDFNYFCNRFKQLTGCTPLEFRAKSRAGEIPLPGDEKERATP